MDEKESKKEEFKEDVSFVMDVLSGKGKVSSTRVLMFLCGIVGIFVILYQLFVFEPADIEWWGPIGLIGIGITGKVAQKFGE